MILLLTFILKPFIAVLIIFTAHCLSRIVWWALPAGKLRHFLFSPLPGQRSRRRNR